MRGLNPRLLDYSTSGSILKVTMTDERIPYVNQVVDAWEEGYKKGLLTFWVLLALFNSPKHMREIQQYIEIDSVSGLRVEEKSLYRSLNRFQKMELVSSYRQPSNAGGPDLKVYQLTATGEAALRLLYERSIKNVFLTDAFARESKGL